MLHDEDGVVVPPKRGSFLSRIGNRVLLWLELGRSRRNKEDAVLDERTLLAFSGGENGEDIHEMTEVESVLHELATGDANRSETARLRDIFDSVEAAQRAGVSRVKILEALHEKGFTMALKSFESALYRIRKQKAKGAKSNESGRGDR